MLRRRCRGAKDRVFIGTRLECRLQDHRQAGGPKNLKTEYLQRRTEIGTLKDPLKSLSLLHMHLGLIDIHSKLRDQVIAPPTSFIQFQFKYSFSLLLSKTHGSHFKVLTKTLILSHFPFLMLRQTQ